MGRSCCCFIARLTTNGGRSPVTTVALTNRILPRDVPHSAFIFQLAIFWASLDLARRYRGFYMLPPRARPDARSIFVWPMGGWQIANAARANGKTRLQDLFLPFFKISKL